jgi:hypothetical protein
MNPQAPTAGMTRQAFAAALMLSAAVAAACGSSAPPPTDVRADAATNPPPQMAAEPSWPKALPNGWRFGNIAGLAVAPDGHIWVLHRPDSGIPAAYGIGPPVMEFEADGTFVQAWGGPPEDDSYTWFTTEHAFYIDGDYNVWITGNGTDDNYALKFTRDGTLLLQIGTVGPREDSNSTTQLGTPADIYVDTPNHEIYFADGYGNKRIIVFDSNTGAYKRHWGAYGNVPDDAVTDPSEQFTTPVHCVNKSRDGLIYVCDRGNERIQVFKPDGTFVEEWYPEYQGAGYTTTIKPFDISFTNDDAQEYLFVADGSFAVPATPGNDRVLILKRSNGEAVAQVGMAGAAPGQFSAIHVLDSDRLNNLYTGELDGGRVQKWVPSK